jgi:hypothetical protein
VKEAVLLHYTVEVRLIGGDTVAFMSDMRSWLDHNRVEPAGFRYSLGTPATSFRVEFKIEEDAISFANAFGGRILGSLSHLHGGSLRPDGEAVGR